MKIHPSELLPGDIIFYNTNFGVPAHAAMYTGIINGNHSVTHSVINERPGLQTTTLKDAGRMIVFRHKNIELGTRAADRMLQWAQYRIPYDTRRRDIAINISDSFKQIAVVQQKQEPIDYLLKILNKEAKNKFYERIKFAARRDTCPVKMLKDQKGRGFICTQAIILAYQISELELGGHVKTLAQLRKELEPLAKTIDQLKEIWISDKHCLDEIIDRYELPESYEIYRAGLCSNEEIEDFNLQDKRFTDGHPHYYPSIVAWNYDLEPSIDEFIKKFNSCFNLPAKLSFTDAMLAEMQKNTEHWEYSGTLDSAQLLNDFTDTEKQVHRSRMSELESSILRLQQEISEERLLLTPRTRSGASSPRPLFFDTGHQSPSSANVGEEEEEEVAPSPLLDLKFRKRFFG